MEDNIIILPKYNRICFKYMSEVNLILKTLYDGFNKQMCASYLGKVEEKRNI